MDNPTGTWMCKHLDSPHHLAFSTATGEEETLRGISSDPHLSWPSWQLSPSCAPVHHLCLANTYWDLRWAGYSHFSAIPQATTEGIVKRRPLLSAFRSFTPQIFKYHYVLGCRATTCKKQVLPGGHRQVSRWWQIQGRISGTNIPGLFYSVLGRQRLESQHFVVLCPGPLYTEAFRTAPPLLLPSPGWWGVLSGSALCRWVGPAWANYLSRLGAEQEWGGRACAGGAASLCSSPRRMDPIAYSELLRRSGDQVLQNGNFSLAIRKYDEAIQVLLQLYQWG